MSESRLHGIRWRPMLWLALRFVLGMGAGWVLLRSTLPWWSPLYVPLGEGILRTFEPTPLTDHLELIEGGQTLQVFHEFTARVPRTPTVRVDHLVQGGPVWWGLMAAVPKLAIRDRLLGLALGTLITGILALLILVARVHLGYANLDVEPFLGLFDNWRGWSAYFVDMFFREVGLFVVPIALAALLYRSQWKDVLALDPSQKR